MNKNFRFYGKYILGILAFGLVSLSFSCTKEDSPSDGREEVAASVKLTNEFVLKYSKAYYLWNDKVSYENKDPRYIEDPFELFDSLIYEELDQWSYLTDDSEAMFNSYEGVETTYGYNLVLGKFSNSEAYFAVVQFVYPDSPAEKAGIKRGDIILKIDGADISDSNYRNLYYSSNIQLQLGEYSAADKTIFLSETKISMSAVKMVIDAVNTYKVIESWGHKVGYICYTDYVPASHTKLAEVCTEFKNAGVTDVVLDLRYNPGGAVASAQYLSSLFVPEHNMLDEDIFLNEIWNEQMTKYWKGEGEELTTRFTKSVMPYNLNLERIYILTTSGTASASESTIVGLSPYMDVITIGGRTHGKYCGAMLLQPLDKNGKVISSIKNWAMSLVVYKFANNDNYTDFKGGLLPDYEVEDDLIGAVYPFGDVNDPHLAKALELITGIKSSPTKVSEDNADVCAFEILKKETRQLNGRRGGYLKKL